MLDRRSISEYIAYVFNSSIRYRPSGFLATKWYSFKDRLRDFYYGVSPYKGKRRMEIRKRVPRSSQFFYINDYLLEYAHNLLNGSERSKLFFVNQLTRLKRFL